jgi:hypothetical protein
VNLPLAVPFEFLCVNDVGLISKYEDVVAPTVIPVLSNFKFVPCKYVDPKVHPPTVPDSALMTPLLDTLNGAEAYVAFPSQIPVAGYALNIEFPDPTERFPVNVPPPLTVKLGVGLEINFNNSLKNKINFLKCILI